MLTLEDSPKLLELALSSAASEAEPPKPVSNVWLEKWRGRLGLDAEAQQALLASSGQDQPSALELALNRPTKKQEALGETVMLQFRQWSGSVISVRCFENERLMQGAKRAG